MTPIEENATLHREIARLDSALDERDEEITRLKLELKNKESLLNILRIHIEKSEVGRN